MENIRSLLLDAINPNKEVRTNAEAKIKAYQKQPGFIVQLPTFFSDCEYCIRKITSIIFKNAILQNWNDSDFAQQKVVILEYIIDIIRIADKNTLTDVKEVLEYILSNEEIENWKVMNDKANHYLNQRQDMKSLQSALFYYDIAIKDDKIKYKQENVDALMAPINNDLLEVLFFSLQCKNFAMTKMVIKIINNLLDTYCTETLINDLNSFLQIFKAVCEMLRIEENDLDSLVLKRFCVKFVNKIMAKAFRNSFSKEEIKKFILEQNHFQFVYGLILELIKKEISNEIEFKEAKDKLLKECSNFFSVLINEGKEHGKIIYNDIRFIIFNFIYPLHVFTEDDEENFEDNPKMYLRERYNYYASDARGYTAVLFTEIIRKIKKEKQLLNTIIQEFIEVLNQYQNQTTKINAYNKFGVIYLLASVSERINDCVPLIVSNYILPDLNSNYIFLRSQASYALQFFNSDKIQLDHMQYALNSVLNNMKNDNLILKADSTLSVTFFFQYEGIQEVFKQSIPYIIENLLELQKNNELEAINDMLESIINNYPEEIKHYAPNLVSCLCGLIQKDLLSFDEEKLVLISSYIRTINELILAQGMDPILIYKIYCICYEIMCSIFKEKITDLYPENIEIFSNFVFGIKQIDDSMWNLFIMSMSIEKEEKIANSEEFIYLIDNCISYGTINVIKYLKLILNHVEIMCNPDDGAFYDDEHISGCKIIESLILYLNKNIVEYIPFFITCATNYYDAFDRETNVMVYYLEIFLQCFILDFDFTLKKIVEENKLKSFFTDLYENRHKFTRVNDKKKILLFISCILVRNENFQSEVEINKINRIFIKTLETLPDAIEKKKKMLQDEYEEDENEYDGLEEDLNHECPLDDINVFEVLRNVFNRLGSFGMCMINAICDEEMGKVKQILSNN
ncbi:Nonsense-mediated mRNA decay protein 5 [Conglomerata obtusa]